MTQIVTTGHTAGKELIVSTNTIVIVRIANFPIINGRWGRVDGVIAAEAEIIGFVGSRNQLVEVRLVNPPAPYEHGEVLVLDVLDDGSFGAKELLA